MASPGDGNPLIQASMEGHVEIARLLLNRGANANAYVGGDETALENAAGEGELEVVEILAHNQNVNLGLHGRGLCGREPRFAVAQRNGEDEVAAYLRSKGAVAQPTAAN